MKLLFYLGIGTRLSELTANNPKIFSINDL